MKTEMLLYSMGNINDDLIADAEKDIAVKKNYGFAKLGMAVACLALIVCAGIALGIARGGAAVGAFTMDVNPGVEYTVAKSGVIKDVRFLNDDAENALCGVDLKKQSVETALTRTVDAYKTCGYMENGEAAVLISFDSRINGNSELKEALSAEIKGALEQTGAVGTLVFHSENADNAEAAELAKQLNISVGKADYILAVSNETGLPADEVALMPLDELLNHQENADPDTKRIITLEEAREIALKDAKLDKTAQKIVFTREELIQLLNKPCYVFEFYTGTNQYYYQIDARSGNIISAEKFITLAEAKKIAVDDAGCQNRVTFIEESLTAGGIKTPYYRLVFADNRTRWTYRIDAVLGTVLEKQQKEIVATDFISLEEAKEIALKDAGLNESTQKIVFTKVELSRNQGKPCYILEFYTGTNQYYYQIDAKNGNIIIAEKFITLAEAKKIAINDAQCPNKVTFIEESLVAGGIKTPYYRLVFADAKTQWTYRIDAVLGIVLEKQQKDIVTTDFIPLEEAKQIALKHAKLDKTVQKVVFTKEELVHILNKPCYVFEFYTGTNQYYYQIDAKNGNIIIAEKFITLAEAKKIAVNDAQCPNKVTFTEETLVAGGIKTPYYRLVFTDGKIQWTYRIDAVLGIVLDKSQEYIGTVEFISSKEAKKIAVDDAGVDRAVQKITFTREELSRNQGRPCYILEFYTADYSYFYKVDAVSGEVIEKSSQPNSRQSSEAVSDPERKLDSAKRGNG